MEKDPQDPVNELVAMGANGCLNVTSIIFFVIATPIAFALLLLIGSGMGVPWLSILAPFAVAFAIWKMNTK